MNLKRGRNTIVSQYWDHVLWRRESISPDFPMVPSLRSHYTLTEELEEDKRPSHVGDTKEN
jgi:hypothetical protein